jgi:hypothetical protein
MGRFLGRDSCGSASVTTALTGILMGRFLGRESSTVKSMTIGGSTVKSMTIGSSAVKSIISLKEVIFGCFYKKS